MVDVVRRKLGAVVRPARVRTQRTLLPVVDASTLTPGQPVFIQSADGTRFQPMKFVKHETPHVSVFLYKGEAVPRRIASNAFWIPANG